MNLRLGGLLEVVGVDEGYFPPEFKYRRLKTIIAAVLCDDVKPLNVVISEVIVDFDDVTSRIANLVQRLGGNPKLILLDGVTYAGFNVVDPKRLNVITKLPVVVVFKHELNLIKIKEALFKHFSDWTSRYSLIDSVYGKSQVTYTPWRPIRISCYGINCSEVVDYIIKLQVTSPIPEPLRLADMIASGLTKNSGLLELINKS